MWMFNYQIKQLTKPGTWLRRKNITRSLCPLPEKGTVSTSLIWPVFLPLVLSLNPSVVALFKESQ